MNSKDDLRQMVEDARHGRDDGWIVEYGGEDIALLDDCWHQYPDMFWDSYKITPLIQRKDILQNLESIKFWSEERNIIFRSRRFPDMPVSAIGVLISPHPEEGRVGARGLFIYIEPIPSPVHPNFWMRIMKWLESTFNGIFSERV